MQQLMLSSQFTVSIYETNIFNVCDKQTYYSWDPIVNLNKCVLNNAWIILLLDQKIMLHISWHQNKIASNTLTP